MNYEAVDRAPGSLFEVKVSNDVTSNFDIRRAVPPEAPEFVQKVTARMLEGRGDDLPSSAFAPDGTFPSGTTQWEKRNIALEIPVWDPEVCIQCGRCSFVCPHAVNNAQRFMTQKSYRMHLQRSNRSHQGTGFSKVSNTQFRYLQRTAPAALCALKYARLRIRETLN